MSREIPNPPWLARKEWARGWISSGSRRKAWALAGFAVLFNALTAPLLWVLPEEVLEKGNHAALLGLLFPLAGLFLLVTAARAAMRWRRFGESMLELETRPGVIGGRFEGRVHTRIGLGATQRFAVRLVCVNRVTTGSGKNRSTRERIRWEERLAVGSERIGRGVRGASIPVGFTIPYDCEPSNEVNRDNAIIWRLEVKAAVAGIDYAAVFPVPVFRTEQSSPEATGDERHIPSLLAGPDAFAERAFPDSKIRIGSLDGGGREFVFRAFRNPGAAASLSGFTLLWLATIPLQLYFGAPALFPIVTGLVGALLVWGSLSLWFRVTRVQVEPGRIAVRSGLFGLGRWKRYASSEISEIRPKIGMQWGQTPYYDLVLVLSRVRQKTGGRGAMPPSRRPAGGAIPDKREAEALAAAMTRALRSGA